MCLHNFVSLSLISLQFFLSNIALHRRRNKVWHMLLDTPCSLMLKCCERKTLFHGWKVVLNKLKRTWLSKGMSWVINDFCFLTLETIMYWSLLFDISIVINLQNEVDSWINYLNYILTKIFKWTIYHFVLISNEVNVFQSINLQVRSPCYLSCSYHC